MAVDSDFEIESIPVSSLNDSDFTLDEEATKKNMARILAAGQQVAERATGATMGALQSPAAGEAATMGRRQLSEERRDDLRRALGDFGLVSGVPTPESAKQALSSIAAFPGQAAVAISDIPTRISNIGVPPESPAYVPLMGEKPKVTLPRIELSPLEEALAKASSDPLLKTLPLTAGAANTLLGTAESFAQPESGLTLPLLGGEGMVGRAAALLFGTQQLAALPEEIQNAITVLKDPNATTSQKVEAVGRPGVGALLAATMVKHGLRGAMGEVQIPGEAMPVPPLPEGPRVEPESKVPKQEPEKASLIKGSDTEYQSKVSDWWKAFREAYNSDNPVANISKVFEELPSAKEIIQSGRGESIARGLATSTIGSNLHNNLEVAGEPFWLWKNRVLGDYPVDAPAPKGAIESIVKPETQPEKGAPDASKVQEAATIHGNLQPFAVEGERQVPTQEGEPRVQSQAGGRLPEGTTGEVLLTPEKPAIAKAGESATKNNLGDPLGTTYHATPEDWKAWQEATSKPLIEEGKPETLDLKRWQEWENIRSKYGGMDPEPPLPAAEAAPPVVRDVPAGSVAPEAIVPAIRLIGGEVVSGKAGETHPDIIKREGLKAEDIDQRGFSDPAGKQFFLDREAAAKGTQVATQREPGRLHSTDLQKEAGQKPPVEFSTFGPIQKAVEYLARKGSALTASASPHVKAAWNFIKDFTKEAQAMPRTSDYRRSVLNWSAKLQRSFGEAADLQRHAESVVKDPVRREAITNWIEASGDVQVLRQRAATTTDPKLRAGYEAAANLTPEELALANQIRQKFDALGVRAIANGVMKSFRDNYVTHIWDLGKTKAIGGGSRTLREKFKFSKARTFDTFFAGEQAGFVPKTKDISKLIPAYLHEMNSVIAARELVAELSKGVASDGRPLVSPKGVGIPVSDPATGQGATLVMPKLPKADMSDYRTLENQPALSDWRWAATDEAGNPVLLKADLALHPEAYSRIKAVLGKSAIREWYQTRTSYTAQIPKTLVAGLDNANKITKATMLGAGSPFHQVQTATHALGHRVNPFFNIPIIDLIRNPEQMDAARHSLMMNPDRASTDQFMEGFRTSGLISKIPLLGKAADWYSHYLFNVYIPGLKFKTYQSILNRNLKVYAKDLAAGRFTTEDVKILSGEQTNAAFGHLNYSDLGRNPTVQHAMVLGFLAPDFLEARGRFAGQSIKGLTGAKVGREQLLALATLAVGQAALAYTGAALTGGEWDKKDPFTFHAGNKKFTIRSVPEDITSLIKNAHQFVHSRLSPIIGKGTLQYLSGVDYRGRKVTAGQTTKELLQQPIPISVRGFLGVGNSPLSGWEQLAGAVGLKISRYSPGAELNTLVDKWRETAGPKQQADLARRQQEVFVSTYQPMKDALTRGDQSRAREEYDKLIATGKKPEDVMKAMRPYTLTKANELKAKSIPGLSAADTQKFLRSLSPEDRKLYDKSKAEQKAQFQRFLDMLKQTKKPLPAKEERIKFAA